MQLTAHFTVEELGGELAPPDVLVNLERLAEFLEAVRAAIGHRMIVTSGFRTPAHNLAIGGVRDSQHMDGTAADVLPWPLDHRDWLARFDAAAAADAIPPYGQLILYPFPIPNVRTGHIHLALPTRNQLRERLVRIATGSGYAFLTPALLAQFPTLQT